MNRPLLWLAFFLVASPSYAQQAGERSNKPSDITNSIGMRFVPIPAGEFMMGGTETADELVKAFSAYHRKPDFFKDEYPRHRVCITKPFYFGKYEVTVGQFRRFVEDTGYKTEAQRDSTGGWGYNPTSCKCEGRDPKYNWRNPGFKQTDDHPVLDVTWNDAVAFCRWLSRREGKSYRLPTEAEWEYAARAGAATRYANGDDPDALVRVGNVEDSKGRTTFPHVQELDIPPGSHPRFTMPVGRFPPNRFGLCDMHGNVWEWCSDWYGEDYYARSPVDDPQGPETGGRRVRRGGGWNSFPLWARASFRNWNTPASRCVNLGFRVVLAPCDAGVSPAPAAGTAAPQPAAGTAAPQDSGAVRIVFGGDVMLDGGPGHAIVHGRDPFADFASLLRGADVAVCNLECVLAPGGQQVLKPYTFRGPQQALPLLKQYFSAVSVANNHTGDFGPDAFVRQLAMFDEARLPCFGGGRDAREARRPLILERRGLRIALLGRNSFPPRSFAAGENRPGVAWLVDDEVVEDVRAARRQDHADVVIPFLHWGREESPQPADWQRQLARRLIDAGATAVVGAHPHVTQTIDLYKGRPIVYSLGNFVFDYYPVDAEVHIGWVVRLTVDRSGATDLETFVLQIDPAGVPHFKDGVRSHP
jgi:formylglycine-generating enzyme